MGSFKKESLIRIVEVEEIIEEVHPLGQDFI